MMYFDDLYVGQKVDRAIFIGYDPREDILAKMLSTSIQKNTKSNIAIIPIIKDQLQAYDIFVREPDKKASTQFSITRFLVPYLMGFKGVGLFMDCDMLVTRDIEELFELYDDDYAVQVVKHDYNPKTTIKMDGYAQHRYPRKNWSSVMLFNCAHPMNVMGLTRFSVERATPKFLHRFEWLDDQDIGELPKEYNWLVDEYDASNIIEGLPFNLHYTLGAPCFLRAQHCDFSDYWRAEFKRTFRRNFTDKDLISSAY